MKRALKVWLTSTRGIRNFWGRLRLRNRNVSVISNDCWGGRMHKFYHLPFNSPFIGLFIVGPDYIAMLEKPDLISLPLNFIPVEQSKWIDYLRSVNQTAHPVARLGSTDLEIHFLHYPDEQTARQKWERRLKRIDWNNAIVKFSDRDVCDVELLRRFDALPFKTKVAFTPRRHPDIHSAVYLPEYKGEEHVSLCWNISNAHWSFVSHANRILKNES